MRCAIVHYHELALKGRNRDFFEQRLIHNIRSVLKDLGATRIESLRSRIRIEGVKAGLLREVLDASGFADPQRLARTIKALSLTLIAPRPIAEAISTAGGVMFESMDARGMLVARAGVFCAGEMLDWEAPTGGYLLTACFASGRAVGKGVADWLGGVAGIQVGTAHRSR